MDQIRQWWQHAASMTLEALRVWWRCLPQMMTAYLIGWMIYELSLVIAPAISGKHPWVALGIVSVGFVGKLSGIIICLRVLGEALGIKRMLPEGHIEDDRDESFSRLLGVTLLPFLGIYAALGTIETTASSLVANEIVIRGMFEAGVLKKANPVTAREITIVALIVAGAYVLRRVVDFLHEKTDFRPLGLVAALIEGFFLMLLLLTGRSLLIEIRSRYNGFRIANWVDSLHEGWVTALSKVSSFIPAAIMRFWSFLFTDLWPLFKGALFQPLVWLAVAALVYGSHVLSFAEMWRKGEPLSVHLDAKNKVILNKRAARNRAAHGGGKGRAALLEVQEALFGDLDDKYLPTFQALRLVLRGGMLFLSAYLVVYSLFSALVQLLQNLVLSVIGGRDEVFWAAWLKTMMVFIDPLGTTLSLALLASAFAATLRIFQKQADPSAIRPDARLDATDKGEPAQQAPVGANPAPGSWIHKPTEVTP